MAGTKRQRMSNGPMAKGSQAKLAFNTTTKASQALTGKELGVQVKAEADITTKIKAEVKDEVDIKAEVKDEVDIKAEVKDEEDIKDIKLADIKHLTPSEQQASKITSAAIRRYWRDREADRLAGRVHQKELSVEEKILRYWDMSSQFGPSIGIPRKKRWQRAHKLNLSPPIEVLAVLMKEEEKGNGNIEIAYVDELMGSKLVVEEV